MAAVVINGLTEIRGFTSIGTYVEQQGSAPIIQLVKYAATSSREPTLDPTNSLKLTSLPSNSLIILTLANNEDLSGFDPYSAPRFVTIPSTSFSEVTRSYTTTRPITVMYYSNFVSGGDLTISCSWAMPNTDVTMTTAAYAFENAITGALVMKQAQEAPSVDITATKSNSFLVAVTNDWWPQDGSSRVYRSTPITEVSYSFFSTKNAIYNYYKSGTTSGTTYTMGLSAPADQYHSTIILEAKEYIYPTIVQRKAYGSSADNTSHTITYDSTPTPGNTLILCVCANDGTVNTPSGWSRRIDRVDFVYGLIFTKTAGASEPGSVTVTIGNTESFSAVFLEVSNLTGTIDQTGSTINQGGTGTISPPSVNTTIANQMLIAVAAYRDEPNTVTGWTNSFNIESSIKSTNAADVNMGISVAVRYLSSTGTYSTSANLSNNGIAHDVGLILGIGINS